MGFLAPGIFLSGVGGGAEITQRPGLFWSYLGPGSL